MCYSSRAILCAIILLVIIIDSTLESTQNRTSKFISIPIPFPLGWARFENSFCISTNGLYGTCYTRRVCNIIDGQASGRCPTSTVGSCCVVQRTCGAISSYNNTYFVNPGFPNPDTTPQSCTITVPPCDTTICQVRLDFLALSLAQPDANGNCVTDALIIEGGASPIPVICGENTGQHIYVGFNGNQSIRITINTDGTTFNRKWTIRIAQIGCDCPTLAPAGCLMFYTAASGTVNSFNFGRTASPFMNTMNEIGTRELANLNYGVCIDMLPGYCSITWNQAAGPYSFSVSGVTPTDTGLEGPVCTRDFVVIPNVVGRLYDRYCGNSLPTLTTYSKPFVLTVVTNGDDLGDVANRGFSLTYSQNPCPINVF